MQRGASVHDAAVHPSRWTLVRAVCGKTEDARGRAGSRCKQGRNLPCDSLLSRRSGVEMRTWPCLPSQLHGRAAAVVPRVLESAEAHDGGHARSGEASRRSFPFAGLSTEAAQARMGMQERTPVGGDRRLRAPRRVVFALPRAQSHGGRAPRARELTRRSLPFACISSATLQARLELRRGTSVEHDGVSCAPGLLVSRVRRECEADHRAHASDRPAAGRTLSLGLLPSQSEAALALSGGPRVVAARCRRE